jgi:hypothetical protein
VIVPVRHPLDPLAARAAVREGRLHGAALLDALSGVPYRERDRWLDALLALPELPADMPGLPRGTVPYLPCGVDAILHAVRGAPVRPDDVFVDLGAGLCRPALCAHLLSGARVMGVELQPHLVELARATAAGLGIDRATFLVGDAAALDIADGTVFFIYSSFNGEALLRVLARLEAIAARRKIVICAVGFDLPETPWLRARPSESPELTFYDSRPI